MLSSLTAYLYVSPLSAKSSQAAYATYRTLLLLLLLLLVGMQTAAAIVQRPAITCPRLVAD